MCIDAIETAYIYRDALIPLSIRAAAEGSDSAGFAEKMMDQLFVELIVGQIGFAGSQFELIGRNKGQNPASF